MKKRAVHSVAGTEWVTEEFWAKCVLTGIIRGCPDDWYEAMCVLMKDRAPA